MKARAFSAAFGASARERLRQPVDLLGGAIFLVLLLYIFASLWASLAAAGKSAGWAVPQLVAYLLVTEIVMLSTTAIHVRIASDVRSGQIAMELLRPTSYAHFELARALGASAVRSAAFLAGGGVALLLLCGLPRLDPRGVAVGLLVLVPLAILVESAVRVIIGLLAFWFEDANTFYWIWQKCGFLLGGVLAPLHLYPEWLQSITRWLPFSAIYFDPARAVVAFDGPAAAAAVVKLAIWLAAVLAVLGAVARRACRDVQLNGG